MKVPLSWLKDFVDIDLSVDELAHCLTLIGLEVDSIQVIGLPMPASDKQEFKITGLSWDPDKIVVGAVQEVLPHPNADRLVLCTLDDGQQVHTVLTGAPNLYPYKGQGRLEKPLKVAYAREGARIYDGHQPGRVLTTLKRAKIRGVESYSMICSEKELGISEEHEGIMFLGDDAPTGAPLVEVIGDAVYEISILPNMIRNACIVGVAREIAAATGKKLHVPASTLTFDRNTLQDKISIEIQNPELNPRFVLGMIRDVQIMPSPFKIQYRLRLAGMRPISNIVDATNYIMLEVGQPLHAFDYDVLVKRASGKTPKIITRTAHPGERLMTLDGVDRPLDPFTVLVCDTVGALSIAGVMGGEESEITVKTRNILLEGATWNFINIRKTVMAQKMQSEAAYRFARGIHPAMAELGVRRCLECMEAWGGGKIEPGLVDNYPLPVEKSVVEISSKDVERLLGITLSACEITDILSRLEFICEQKGEKILVQAPDHRLDIGKGVVGKADILEEVARIYGYDKIPEALLSDTLPPQRRNPSLEGEEKTRDLCVALGLQEVINYRLTMPEREARIYPGNMPQAQIPYVRLQNPISPERSVMRHSVLASVLEVVERNIRLNERLALFEIGQVYLPQDNDLLPAEPTRLVIVMTGKRSASSWDIKNNQLLDFYDIKGVVEALLDGLHIQDVCYESVVMPSYHPGKCAQVKKDDNVLGYFGELHPLVKKNYDFGEAPVLAAEFDLDLVLQKIPERFELKLVPSFPPVLEDIAIIVDENLPAARIEQTIRQAGGKLLTDIRLFDIFRSEQIGSGKKSMAYSLTYQAPDRTLTDQEAAQIRQRIIRRLEQDLGAMLRS